MKRVLGIAAALAAFALLVFLLRGERATSAPDPGAKAPAGGGLPAAELVAGADGGSAEPRRVEPPATGAGVDVATPAAAGGDGCTVQGRVTEASGAELVAKDGCRIRFEDANGEAQTANAEEDGVYSISGLAPGRWLVACSPLGYRPAQEVLAIPAGARSLRHDIALRRAAGVRVSALAPDGRPLAAAARDAGAQVLAMSLLPVATAAPPGEVFEGVWGSSGNPYGAGHLASQDLGTEPPPPGYMGTLLLDGDPPVYVSLVLRSAVLATQVVGQGQGEVRFTLTPEQLLAARSALRLRAVEAETLAPLAGAKATLWGGPLFSDWPGADEQGVLALEGLAPGTYDLWLHAPGREHLRRSITLPPGGTLDLGTVALAPEVRISGRVVDGAGKPLDATLELGRIDPVTRRVEMFSTQIWSSYGMVGFTIEGLGRGEYVLRTNAMRVLGDDLHPRNPFLGERPVAGVTPNQVVSTLGGSVKGLKLVVVPLGRLLLRSARPDPFELRYEVLDGQGLARAEGRIRASLQFSVDVPRGAYRLRVTSAAGGVVLEQAVAVGETPVVIDLPRE